MSDPTHKPLYEKGLVIRREAVSYHGVPAAIDRPHGGESIRRV